MRFRHPYNSNIGKQCVRWVSPAMLVFTPQLRSRSPILNMNTEFYNAAQVTLHQQQKQEQQKQPQWQSEKEMTTSSNNRAAAGSGGSSGSTSESRSGKTSESFSSSGSGSRRNSTKSLTYRYPWPHLHTRKRLLRVFLCWTAAGGSHSHSNTYWRPKLAAATFPLQQWRRTASENTSSPHPGWSKFHPKLSHIGLPPIRPQPNRSQIDKIRWTTWTRNAKLIYSWDKLQSSSCLWRDLISADSSPWSFSNSTSKLLSALCNCALRTLLGRFRDVLIFFSSATGDFDRGDLDRASTRPTGSGPSRRGGMLCSVGCARNFLIATKHVCIVRCYSGYVILTLKANDVLWLDLRHS